MHELYNITHIIFAVLVDDVNDNAPVIWYPNSSNNTIMISNKLPEGYLITRVNATDMDVASNAMLKYKIHETNNEKVFTIDSQTGEIRVKGDLDTLENHTSVIAIEVMDNGYPSLQATTELTVKINASIPFIVSYPKHSKTDEGGSSTLFTSKNWWTVGIAVGLFLLIVIVVIIIAGCRRRHEAKQKKHKYNCRVHAQRRVLYKQNSNDYVDPDKYSEKPAQNGSAVIIRKDSILENGECIAGGPLNENKQKIVLELDMEVGESCTDDAQTSLWANRYDNTALIAVSHCHTFHFTTVTIWDHTTAQSIIFMLVKCQSTNLLLAN